MSKLKILLIDDLRVISPGKGIKKETKSKTVSSTAKIWGIPKVEKWAHKTVDFLYSQVW